MEALFDLLGGVIGALLGVIGIIITQRYTTKREKMQIDHTGTTNAYNALSSKVDKLAQDLQTLTDEVKETKASAHETKELTLQEIRTLSARVEKHNNVVERTFKLEQDVAVLDNREKVSEKRLADLERHEEINLEKKNN